jgi:hypothetical protein
MTFRLVALEQSILAKAFRGELVLEDSIDEPSEALPDCFSVERERANSGLPKPQLGKASTRAMVLR